jgi:RNA polymerase sigma-70 factor (ECF subfamily)
MPAVKRFEARTESSIVLDPKNWVNSHADYLFRYAFARIRDQDLAKDLVQETFLAGLKGLAGFSGKSTERTWLTAILKYKIIDHYRKESSGLSNIKAFVKVEEIQDDYFVSDNGHWKSEHVPKLFKEVQDPLQDKEFNRVLQACMNKLPALWSSVFAMKHMDEEKTEVILAQLRLSSANFWVIIHRTKLSLRACLQQKWL